MLSVIRNPSYAGAYVFGRYQYQKTITADGEIHQHTRSMPTQDWRVYLRDHHVGYITMDEFEKNRALLERNRTNGEATLLNGPAREGLALLQGMLLCGCCGHALTMRYQGNGGIYPTYLCSWKRREGLATKDCLSVRTDLLDQAICEEIFKVLKPAELELAFAAMNELEQRDQTLMHQWQMRVERADYEAALAERRYEESDPSNRLVTGTLERRWKRPSFASNRSRLTPHSFSNAMRGSPRQSRRQKSLRLRAICHVYGEQVPLSPRTESGYCGYLLKTSPWKNCLSNGRSFSTSAGKAVPVLIVRSSCRSLSPSASATLKPLSSRSVA